MKIALINLISDQAIPNLLAIKKVKPVKVYFIHSHDSRYQMVVTNFKKYMAMTEPSASVETRLVDPLTPQSTYLACMEIIKQSNVEKVVIHATGGTKLMAFGALQAGNEMNCPVIYVNTPNQEFLHVNGHEIGLNEEKLLPPVLIKEFVELYGATMGNDKTTYAEKHYQRFMPFVNYVITHLEQWKETSTYLNLTKNKFTDMETGVFNGPIYIQHPQTKRKIQCNTEILEVMAKQKLVTNYEVDGQTIRFSRNKLYDVDWLLQYGTAMELYVYSIFRRQENVDDVKMSVEFVWDSRQKVNNELDIIVSSKSRLTCISCKSGNVATNALNELETYGRLIGGTFVNKVLVTTRDNFKQRRLLERAKSMGIEMIAMEEIITNPKKLLERV